MIPVYVPYTYRHEPTWDALELTGRPLFPVNVSNGDGHGYLRMMRARWLAGVDWINVEHDVIITAGQLDQLDNCPAGWCCFNEYDGGPPTLSCARFRPAFMERWRHIWVDLWDRWQHRQIPQPTWTRLDSWLTDCCGQPCLHTSPHIVNARPHGVMPR